MLRWAAVLGWCGALRALARGAPAATVRVEDPADLPHSDIYVTTNAGERVRLEIMWRNRNEPSRHLRRFRSGPPRTSRSDLPAGGRRERGAPAEQTGRPERAAAACAVGEGLPTRHRSRREASVCTRVP
jgi:hypothetical protein